MSAASSGGETALAAASAFRKAWEGADNRTREAMEEAVGLEPGAVGQLRAKI